MDAQQRPAATTGARPLARSGVVARLASYGAFRWLLRITLALALFQALLQWVVTPLLVFTGAPNLFDFTYYYDAALALRENPHANLYDPRVLPALAAAHHLFWGGGQFSYPLLLPVLLIPLALLSFQTAARLWFAFNLLLWLLNTALLISWVRAALSGDSGATSDGAPSATSASGPRGAQGLLARWRALPDSTRFAIYFGAFLSLSYAPLIQTQALGQASMLIYTCFLLIPWLVRRGRPEIAGALLAIVTLIKLFPALLIMYYLFQRRWRVALAATAGLALLLAGITAVVGVSGLLTMRSLLAAAAGGVLTTFQNESLARVPLWLTIEIGGQPSVATALLGDALIAVIALAFALGLLLRARLNTQLRTQTPGDEDERLGYCWALCTMILIAPISWEHYDIWLLPPIVLCLGVILRQAGPLLRRDDATGRLSVAAPWALLGLGAVIAALALTFYDLPLGYDGTVTLSLGPYILGHPLRPPFMLLRPTAALLLWLVTGALYLRPLATVRGVAQVAVAGTVPFVPWRRLGGALLGVFAALILVRAFTLLALGMAVATPR